VELAICISVLDCVSEKSKGKGKKNNVPNHSFLRTRSSQSAVAKALTWSGFVLLLGYSTCCVWVRSGPRWSQWEFCAKMYLICCHLGKCPPQATAEAKSPHLFSLLTCWK